MVKYCVGPGIDHTAKRADGTHALWPNEHGTAPPRFQRELPSSGLWRTSVILREAHYKWKNMMVMLWLFSINSASPNNY
jgi:hypothetical protein